ncbi:uncharacterized protein LOC128223928 isoform X2 [Mya arenaria]|nr:uncharacterized protein LOC128223928 isoform X2 [Mya arenaria]XP_052789371.1 uncharacterized protein LOC128223928 isoform X2 [Mya arenaria]XP_052789372.1 uncharacterized protein LOC128223928 isoform X2 [Mya arenaria]
MVFDCTLEERKTRWLTFGFLILLITQTVTFLGLISGWRFKYPTSSPLETNRQCMACDDLKSSLYNINNTDKDINALRQKHNSSLCYGDVHNVVRLLTKKELSLQYYDSSTAYSSIIGESFVNNCDLERDIKTPKAKLVGVLDAVPSFIVQGDSKLRWNKKQPYIHCKQLHSSGTRGGDLRQNTRLLHRFGTTSVLMQRNKSIKEQNHDAFTSLLSAVFKLQKHDRISVSVSHPEFISRNSSADNFIAYFTYNFT